MTCLGGRNPRVFLHVSSLHGDVLWAAGVTPTQLQPFHCQWITHRSTPSIIIKPTYQHGTNLSQLSMTQSIEVRPSNQLRPLQSTPQLPVSTRTGPLHQNSPYAHQERNTIHIMERKVCSYRTASTNPHSCWAATAEFWPRFRSGSLVLFRKEAQIVQAM